MVFYPLRLLVLLLAALAQGACGGGGSSGGDTPPAVTYSLSGRITAADNLYYDSDVNDPDAPYADNDTPAVAQPVGNPARISGYVNQPGSGPAGRSFAAGDTDDDYSATLFGGQQLVLRLGSADTVANDLDLLLLDANGRVVGSSLGSTAATETLVVPSDGRYNILVHATLGASAYVLELGAAPLHVLAAPGLDLAADFVPGEAIVRYRPTRNTAAGRLRPARAPDTANRPRRIRLPVTASATTGDVSGEGKGRVGAAAVPGPLVYPSVIAESPALRRKWDTLLSIKALQRRDDVLYAEPNYLRRTRLVPDDPRYPEQWHLPLVNAPTAWDTTTGLPGVVAAVLDTGVLPAHPDLSARLVAGYDFVSDPATSGDGDGIDANPEDPGDKSEITSSGGTRSSFHGTMVGGILAATINNAEGVAGLAGAIGLMPVRVVGIDSQTTSYDLQQGILYAAGLPNDSGTVPAVPADVINISLGGTGYSQAERDVLDQARAQGTIAVASAGNDRSSDPNYPAAYSGVIGVSATARNLDPAIYSNFGHYVDLAAPGGDTGSTATDGILTAWADDSAGAPVYGYRFTQGTSMSAPIVAGVLALMKSADPALTPDDIGAMLSAGLLSDDLGDPGYDPVYGFGFINAAKALAAVADRASLPPTLGVFPASLDFDPTLAETLVWSINLGQPPLDLLSVTADVGWLSAIAETTDASGLGSWRIQVDRTGLTPGTYNGQLSFVSSANTIQIPVTLQVAASTPGNAGHLYVELRKATTGALVTQQALDPAGGTYNYSLNGIPAGTYLLSAGDDPDNDGVLCQGGSACGAWITLQSPRNLVIDQDRTGIDFGVDYP